MPITWMPPSIRPRHASVDRRSRAKSHRRRIALESLEDRTVLSTFTWSGANLALWSAPGSWTISNANNAHVIPGAGDDVVFDGSATTDSVINQAFTVRSVSVQSAYVGTISVDPAYGSLATTGDLTFGNAGVVNVNAATGKIRVYGNLASTAATVGGTADISMVNAPQTSPPATITGGDFPNGGIIINKPSSSVTANVTQALDGPLDIQNAFRITGVLTAGRDVTTRANVAGDGLGGGKIVFAGDADQEIFATNANARLPGVEINKGDGTLTLPNNVPLRVDGSWIVVDGNKGVVDANGGAVKFTRSATVNTGTTVNDPSTVVMTFNDVEVAINSDTLTVRNMVVDGDLTLTSVYYVKDGAIIAKGDVTTNAAQGISSNGGAILFAGGGPQQLTAGTDNAGIPAVVIDKSGGALAIVGANRIGVTGSWTHLNGVVSAAGSTVRFRNVTANPVVDTGSDPGAAGSMRFGNVEIAINSNTMTATRMAIGGDLTIDSVWAINGATGKITVLGSLTSNDSAVAGTADITLYNLSQTSPPATITGGDFPNGGLIINKPSSSVTVNVTQALDGPLDIQNAFRITGDIWVGKNVTTSAAVAGDGIGGGRIIFVGGGNQTLTATTATARVPGVVINKTGGALTLASTDASKRVNVDGSWTVVGGNQGVVNPTDTTVRFTRGATVDTGSGGGTVAMTFNNVDVDMGSFSLTATKMAIGGNLTLTSAFFIHGPGAITVEGDLTSTDAAIAGAANITMIGGGDANITGGDFPDGGIVIAKTGGAKVSMLSNLSGVSSVAVNSGVLNLGDKTLVVGGPMSVAGGAKLAFTAPVAGGTQLSVAGNLTFDNGSLLDADMTNYAGAAYELVKVTGAGKSLINNGVTATANNGYAAQVNAGVNGTVKII